MEKLFQEFDKASIDQWLEQIHADLKGKSDQILVSEPEKDIRIKAFYHNDEAPYGTHPIGRSTTGWINRKFYNDVTNKLILNDLNEGINGLSLQYTNQVSFDELTKGVQFEHIQADVSFEDALAASAFIGPSSIILNLDLIALGLKSGEWKHEAGDYLKFFNYQDKNKTVWISGSIYGEAGASTVQELAFTLNHLNEHIQLLVDNGKSLAEINEKICIELSITDDFFMNIAKFKLIRQLVPLVFEAYDPTYEVKEFLVFGKTSQRYLTLNDSNNNLLRQTTEAMSAIIGGCNSITVQPLSTGDYDKDEIYKRMAKNIPLILQEESHLDKVSDAAEGSYYVEHLCAQVENRAWELFKSIEKQGGLMAAIEKNIVQDQIAENRNYLIEAMNNKTKTVLGVNKYPSTLENWKEITNPETRSGSQFKPLGVFRIEDFFKKEVHEQSKL
ncbi:MAG: methylmalonyl-CoA mutase family protein [Crocinitomicaceae bacterium]